jgi:hypothetical protein
MRTAQIGKKKSWEIGVATKDVWAKAEELFEYILENPLHGATKLGNHYNWTYNQSKSIVKKIKSGWNPSTDPAYLSWLASYKLKQEVLNGPPTI